MIKIIATSDWHLGNMFHGIDRLPEHKHFLQWLLQQVEEHQPDALLVAGDVFDNSNPSAAAQETYYGFLADVTKACPRMHIIITAGNHDSASRIEAPRTLLSRFNVETRGNVHRAWNRDSGDWAIDYDDLIIPVTSADFNRMVVLAVPYLRNDIAMACSSMAAASDEAGTRKKNVNYSDGVNCFLRELTQRARQLYSGLPMVMMAHMYASGADIATRDASERIVIGGQEQVAMNDWNDHPDYLTCGHIHRRQKVWDTSWARYSGSVLPMSFAERDYTHGVDLITLDGTNAAVEQLTYTPQHRLVELPKDDDTNEYKTVAQLKKLIKKELRQQPDGGLSDNYDYVSVKVKMDKVSNDVLKAIEDAVTSMDAILCKIQKVYTTAELTTVTGQMTVQSVEDVLNRDPLEALKECFKIKTKTDMNERQESMLRDIVDSIMAENND